MDQIIISVVSLGGAGLIFGLVLSFLDKKLKVEEDPLVEEIINALPGGNCGACGFPGCSAFAKEAAAKRDLLGGCTPGGDIVNKKIASLLGVEAGPVSKFKVIVLCGSRGDQKKASFDYNGPKTCSLSNISLGRMDCRFGCLGFGDCVSVCPVNALTVEDYLVVVDHKKCIGCGKCLVACPRGILQLVEPLLKNIYVVSCSNPEKGPFTKRVCAKGCIGCGICIKLVKDSPFYLDRWLSKIDYKKIKAKQEKELDLPRDKCPVKIINKFDV